MSIVTQYLSRLGLRGELQERVHLLDCHEANRLPHIRGLQWYQQNYSACILAYGQTSSGKTYTMKGVDNNLGLIPLTIRHIFKRIK
jgi:hypothetical protein